MLRALSCLYLTVFLAVAAICGESPTDAAKWGRENIAAGKYKEAVELLTKEIENVKESGAIKREIAFVLVEAQRIVGKYKEARDVLEKLRAEDRTLKEDAKKADSDIRMVLAELDVDVGRYKEAREAYDKIIAEQPDNQRAWALRSIVLREMGDAKTLKATSDHFFQFNQKGGKQTAMDLAYTGLGIQDENPKSAFEDGFMEAENLAAQPDANVTEIFLWSGRLAHAKYHFGYADKRYADLLKLRPKLPDALSGHAAVVYQATHKLDDVEKTLKEALEVNPHHVESLLLKAQVDLEEERYSDAKAHIDAALAVNPNSSRGLSLLGLYFIELNQPDKYAEVEAHAKAVKAVCPDFYCDIGELMENKRGFNTAAKYYKKAIEVDPEYWRGYYGLGMNTSRQGAFGEEEGKEMLLKAFKKNRFNLWASNMIKVLDRFVGDKEQQIKPVYGESKTEHFTLKFFGKESEIVRPYLEEWAEAAYASQAKKFNYTPEGPLTIELCYSFQDQAARTVGLPNLGALGVCFGKLCTVVSPREGSKDHPPFNWRKVV